MILPVILSGGSGTRVWPISREQYPKQFLPLVGSSTLFEETVQRTTGDDAILNPVVVCNADHRFLVAEQLQSLGLSGDIILEPVGRNTAPAIAIAALHACKDGDDPVLLVLPSDHNIENVDEFMAVVATASSAAKQGCMVTFGIVPTAPETGYGYIKKGGALTKSSGFKVDTFVEKPDSKTAETYVESGNYLWNSGMFMFKASCYLQELEKHSPNMIARCREAYDRSEEDLDFIRIDTEAFSASPSDSIDYAVMEKTDAAAVFPLNVGWSDVGSWASLWEVGEKDSAGNVLRGDTICIDSKESYIHADSRLVAAVGLENVVVVETGDAVLVADKSCTQQVKDVVEKLKREKRSEIAHRQRVLRPWGHYQTVDLDDRFQVKRIMVKPGEKLSLQKHHHRAEHWIVVKGTAVVTCGDEERTLGENQSTYIPLGVVHRLENPGKIPLEIIEVQSGSYLGEDDIVRFDDQYGRGE